MHQPSWLPRGAAALVVGLCVAAAGQGGELPVAERCAALAGTGKFENGQVQKAQWIAASPQAGLGAYCEVTASTSSGPGSRITAVFRLPEAWNGRMLGLGGGGWAGNLTLQAASNGLKRGYATAQTDAGHPSANSVDLAWARGNPVAMSDFAHRGIHQMTSLGKQVVAAYYEQAPRHSFFQGCSTGGRQGLMEAQRYPADYDAIIAAAPVYSLLVQTSNVVRDQIFKAPGAAIPVPLVARVNKAVLAACDAKDGLADGVVTDPRKCGWDPAQMQCPAGKAGEDCLTPAQVTALRKAYTTLRDANGVVGNYALTRGGEAGWNPFVPTVPEGQRTALNGDLGELVPYIFPQGGYDPASFDPVRQQGAVHRTPFAAEYEASDPDLSAFLGRGGKLLLWHGFDDPGPSAYATIDYYEAARRANGPGAAIQLYVAPGVYHCRGGPGADDYDPLAALEQWVEKGTKPGVLTARNVQRGFERPLCPYPQLPYYRGGDDRLAGSFGCR
jgi:feruloyl esterase